MSNSEVISISILISVFISLTMVSFIASKFDKELRALKQEIRKLKSKGAENETNI